MLTVWLHVWCKFSGDLRFSKGGWRRSVSWDATPGKFAQRHKCFGDAFCICFLGSRRRLTIPSLVPTHASNLPLHPRHSSHIVSSTIRAENRIFILACVFHPHPREMKLPSLPVASYFYRLAWTCPVKYLFLDCLEEGDSKVLRNVSTRCNISENWNLLHVSSWFSQTSSCPGLLFFSVQVLEPLGMELRDITVRKKHRQTGIQTIHARHPCVRASKDRVQHGRYGHRCRSFLGYRNWK